MNPSGPGALVIGGYVNALGAVRALASAGVPVEIVTAQPYDIAHRSRLIRAHHPLPELEDNPESLIDLLVKERERWRGWTILPTHDAALDILARKRSLLRRWYPSATPHIEIVRRILDKRLTAAAARQAGIEVPRSYGPPEAALRDPGLAFPVVLKPVVSHLFWAHFGRKLIVARNAAELRSAAGRVPAAEIPVEVLDLVPGPDSSIVQYAVYMDRRGEPTGEFVLRKIRQAPPRFGVARAAEPAPAEVVRTLRERTVELLRRIEWRGIAAAEYKLDPRDGQWRLFEVNGRLFLANALAHRAGVNLPLLAWREASLGEQVAARVGGWRGTWIHLHADIHYTAWCLRWDRPDWGELLRSYRGPLVEAVWSRSDPGPFLLQWGRAMAGAPRILWDAARREEIQSRVEHLAGPE